MKHQNFIRGVGEMDDRILERYHAIDTRLAHKHAGKAKVLRVMAIAACMAILVCALAPVGMLAHPAGRAVLQGDSEALTEQLNKIEGFAAWQESTAEKLEQKLPEGIFGLLQTTPIVNVLTQSQFSGLAAQETFKEQENYHLYFVSNGDGTCALKYITTNAASQEDFTIEIPETSPAGDRVVAIDLQQPSFQSQSLHADFPYVLTAATMESLLKSAQWNMGNAFNYNKFAAYFLRLSLTDLDEVATQELLGIYPIVEYGDIYVFDRNATQGEQDKIYEYLTEYCGWNQEAYAQSIAEIIKLAKQSGSREKAELCLTALRNTDLRSAVSLTIPASVTSISGATWSALQGLETVTVAQGNPMLRIVDGCLIHTATGTLKLYLREDGKFPESADIRILDCNAFALCTLQPDADGKISLHIPEGVTEIRKNCFTEISFGAGWSGDVYLPESLQTFGGQAQGDFELIYHYPGTMEEWESRVTFTDINQKSYINLVTTDSNEPIRYVFMED